MWGDGRSLVVLVVRTQRLHHCSPGSVPSLGTQIPHQATAGRGQKKKKKRKGWWKAWETFASGSFISLQPPSLWLPGTLSRTWEGGGSRAHFTDRESEARRVS